MSLRTDTVDEGWSSHVLLMLCIYLYTHLGCLCTRRRQDVRPYPAVSTGVALPFTRISGLGHLFLFATDLLPQLWRALHDFLREPLYWVPSDMSH